MLMKQEMQMRAGEGEAKDGAQLTRGGDVVQGAQMVMVAATGVGIPLQRGGMVIRSNLLGLEFSRTGVSSLVSNM